jgi:hypothetical protein
MQIGWKLCGGANIAPIMQTTLPETAPQVEESEIKEP